MKKHLIAAAVAAAVAVPAMAQVEVYGGFDTGVQIYDLKGGDSASGATEGRIYSSRIGFRGSEDLGGGLKASFILEARLGANSGSLGAFSGTGVTIDGDAVSDYFEDDEVVLANGGTQNIFNREASLTLSGGFGAISAGRLDLSAAEGIDTMTSQIGNLAFASSAFELAGDVEKAFRYTSPTMNGVTFQVGYANLATESKSVLTEASSGEISSVSVTYVAGPLAVGAGYTTVNGATDDTKVTTLGARYDFGVARVGLFYGTHKVGSTDVDAMILSASAPLGNGLSLIGSYRTSDDGIVETTDINFGASKALSKRTTLYGIIANTSLEGGSTGGSAYLLGASDKEASRYMVNVVHTF